MKKEFNQLKKRVDSLIPILPQETDVSWLVSIYFSLNKAYELNYQYDAISKLIKSDQADILLKISSLNFTSNAKLSKEERTWLAGYYFNNAMFRMVALTEIGLKILFEQKMKVKPPKDYGWLSKWYLMVFGKNLINVQNARSRVNKQKHELRGTKNSKQFESMKDGIYAFNELLSLLEDIQKQI